MIPQTGAACERVLNDWGKVLKVMRQQGDWAPIVIEHFGIDNDYAVPNGRFVALRLHPIRQGEQYVAGRFAIRPDSEGGTYFHTISYDLTRERADQIFQLLGK